MSLLIIDIKEDRTDDKKQEEIDIPRTIDDIHLKIFAMKKKTSVSGTITQNF